MTDLTHRRHPPDGLPSINETRPTEEGGPIARSGFSYQDEVAVRFLIEMLQHDDVIEVQCETHDDIVLLRTNDSPTSTVAEYVQVKAARPDKLWSIADLCAREKKCVGTSILEKSLNHDRVRENARFRIVTLYPVVGDLEVLTFPLDSPGRCSNDPRIVALRAEIENKLPGVQSPLGNSTAYWIEHCQWEWWQEKESIENKNLLSLLRQAAAVRRPLLPEHAEALLNELRRKVKNAGDLTWDVGRDKKRFSRSDIRSWWLQQLDQLGNSAASPSGSQLRDKMQRAGLTHDMIGLAQELRREYVGFIRTPRYQSLEDPDQLPNAVRSVLATLRSRFIAGEFADSGVAFHTRCLKEMDKLAEQVKVPTTLHPAHLKGCLYDITDRCLFEFAPLSL